MLSEKKILITGGAGFIGSNLCEYFLQNNSVVCFDNLSSGKKINIEPFLKNPDFTFIEGDIRDYDACVNAVKGCEIVLHQAARGSVPRSIVDPLTTNAVNITGFLNMLQATKEAGIKRFVYASSSSVYGDLAELPKREEKIGNPLSPYAVTKLVNEHYAQVYHRLFGMEVIGLRYFNVFGKNQDPDGEYAAAIPRFIKAILKGQSPVIFGDGKQTRDFTYIKNVVHANACAASTQNNDAFSKLFNVAYGTETTVSELIDVLIREIGNLKNQTLTIKPSFQPERKGDVKFSQASVDLARNLIGYNPQYSFDAGIKEAVKWYVENL
ncbi:MAG TPA: SDR family oxidoreductase [Flavobacteriales bacterium]|nr:SDR family oxidoreductase [Flavobacteriales bacterium]